MADPRDIAARVTTQPDPSPDRPHRKRFAATAPYGLVRLAGSPVPAHDLHHGHDTEDLLRSHDRTVDGAHTGWIDLTMTTLTPTFVGRSPERGTVSRSLRFRDGEHTLPAVPGSTLRGLVRNTVRMLTGGETGPVNTPMLFFRAPVRVDPDGGGGSTSARGRHVMARRHGQYRKRRIGLRTQQGFLFREPEEDRWYVVAVPATPLGESGQALKVSLDVLRQSLNRWDFGGEDLPDPPHGLAPASTGHARHDHLQHRWVHAVRPPGHREVVAVAPTEEQAHTHLCEYTEEPGGAEIVPALVVLTGAGTGERRNAYLFPRPRDLYTGRLPVPDALVELFESAAQVTGHQRGALPDTPGPGRHGPQPPPVVGDGGGGPPRRDLEPIWYDIDVTGEVVSFGRSGGYRIAVSDENPIRRAVPETVLGPQHGDHDRAKRAGRTVDVCRALFGDTDTFAGESGASKGRVFFGSALSRDPDPDLPGGPLRVRLLSPQRGCFANYLLQGPDTTAGDRPDIITWSHEGRIHLSGYKIYLHRHRDELGSPVRYDRRAQEELGLTVLGDRPAPPRRVERDVVPLRDGLTFHSRVTFTNLTDEELGVLLRALLLANPVDGGDPRDPEHAHKLGMGKSLGFGSVHLRPELYLVDRRARALSLDPTAGVTRATGEHVQAFLDAFGAALVRRRLPGPADSERWQEVEQAVDVCLASRWRRRLPWEETAVMSLQEFAEFPVLPSLTERFR